MKKSIGPLAFRVCAALRRYVTIRHGKIGTFPFCPATVSLIVMFLQLQAGFKDYTSAYHKVHP